MKNLVLSLTIILLLFNCKKQEELPEKKYKISGQLINDCSGIPIANDTLILKMTKWRWLGATIVETAMIKTDSKGYFNYSYSPKTELNQAVLKDKLGKDIIKLSINKSYNFGKFILKPKANYQYQLKFKNNYQTGDTLYISQLMFVDSIIKIPAPFKDTAIPTVFSVPRFLIPEFENRNKINGTLNYSIHGNPTSTAVWYETKSFLINACSGINEIVIVEIE